MHIIDSARVRMSTKPKKAGGAKGKKGKKVKKGEKGEQDLEERYKRTLHEITSLRVELDSRTEHARRSRMAEEEMRVKVEEAKETVQEEKQSKMDITTDMARQYKSMQTQLEMRIQFLEAEVKRLTAQLDESRLNLYKVTEERDRLKKEKEEQYQSLMRKMKEVEMAYEAILQETLDSMAVKLEACRTKWSNESVAILKSNMQLLQEFGLVPQTSLAS